MNANRSKPLCRISAGITGKILKNAEMRSKIGKRTGGGDNLNSPGIRP
ncbi:MAG: hypothetical protein LBH00_04345 [Planctomycetaceae bacterium]|nr:hypothetical protein [Planctomycetaceae bacterium]